MKTGPLDLSAREIGLRLAERDAERAHSVMAAGEYEKPAPPASKIEKPLTLLKAQLATDAVELPLLGLPETRPFGLEIPARVDHLRIEPQGEERRRQVVVVRHRFSVSFLRVRFSEQSKGAPARPRRAGTGQGQQEADHAQVLDDRQRTLAQVVHEREDRVQVALHVEVGVDIGFAERALARAHEHPPDGLRSPEHEGIPRSSVRGSSQNAIADPDQEVALRVSFQQKVENTRQRRLRAGLLRPRDAETIGSARHLPAVPRRPGRLRWARIRESGICLRSDARPTVLRARIHHFVGSH